MTAFCWESSGPLSHAASGSSEGQPPAPMWFSADFQHGLLHLLCRVFTKLRRRPAQHCGTSGGLRWSAVPPGRVSIDHSGHLSTGHAGFAERMFYSLNSFFYPLHPHHSSPLRCRGLRVEGTPHHHHRFMCLNTQAPASSTIWEGFGPLGDVALLESGREWVLGFHSSGDFLSLSVS